MKFSTFLAAMLFLAVWQFFAGPLAATEKVTPQSLFEQRCATCHKLDRSDRLESPENWKIIVERMRTKRNGKIFEADAELITRYLSDHNRQTLSRPSAPGKIGLHPAPVEIKVRYRS